MLSWIFLLTLPLFQLHFQITHETDTEHHPCNKVAIIETIGEESYVERARGMKREKKREKSEQMKASQRVSPRAHLVRRTDIQSSTQVACKKDIYSGSD